MQHAAREHLHREAHGQHDEHVAADRGRLRADQRDHRRHELLHAFVVAGAVELARDRRRGHRRLLRREREVQEVHQHEARRVVDAGEQPFEHRLQVRARDPEFDADGGDRHEAAARRHAQHLQVFGAAARDVVLARVRVRLDELAREQGEVAAHEVRHALAVLVRVDELGRQAREPAQIVARHPRVQQRLRAQDAHAHALDLEHDVDRYAVAVQVREHVVDRHAALVEQHAQVIDLVQQLARVATVVEHGLRGLDGEHRAREPVERLRFERRARILVRQAAAHGLRQPRRADLAGEVVQRGEQVARERAGLVALLVGHVEREQVRQPGEQIVGQRVDPLRVGGRRKHQREERGELAAVRRGRNQRRIDALDKRAEEARMHGHAGVAQERDAVAFAQHAAQQARDVRLPGGVAVEHVEYVAQPCVRGERAFARFGLRGRGGGHRAVAMQPVRELDQPFGAFRVRRVRVGCREERVELMARAARRAPLLDQGRQGFEHKREYRAPLRAGFCRDAAQTGGEAQGRLTRGGSVGRAVVRSFWRCGVLRMRGAAARGAMTDRQGPGRRRGGAASRA
ncbi:hypothetical protein DP49_7053 [Burkholderia pseudomallei]|nr:hypothetical protein DP49_7053 [Burkholderia pseudomallei]